MEIQTLRELYVDTLKDMYSAEKQIVRSLPKMIKAASSEDLSTALREHLEVTEQQVARLEQIFQGLGSSGRGKKCKGMQGLLEEGGELIEEGDPSPVLDAGMIIAAQKVEHYEIAAYGSLRTFAEMLGETDAVDLLDQSLVEEKEADETLTEIAERTVNPEATAQHEPERAARPAKTAGRR
jgi:ferritin-like metal-binding protein YciE